VVIADAEQTPKTPSVSGASSRGRPSSPNGASTPWTKSSTRSSSQHDHLKSVWDQAGTPEPSLPIEPFATQKPLMPARKQATDTASPMYPSLNAPSSADPPAPQPLPSSVKMGYSNSQSFSSPGSAPQSTSFRQSPGNNYGYTSPDVGQSMMGLSYASLGGARPNGSSANGFPGVQQGVWSASAFGTGYGYGAKAAQSIAGMDHKAATAFNTATNGKNQAQMYHTAYAQHAQSPQGYPPQGFGGAQSYGQAQSSRRGRVLSIWRPRCVAAVRENVDGPAGKRISCWNRGLWGISRILWWRGRAAGTGSGNISELCGAWGDRPARERGSDCWGGPGSGSEEGVVRLWAISGGSGRQHPPRLGDGMDHCDMSCIFGLTLNRAISELEYPVTFNTR